MVKGFFFERNFLESEWDSVGEFSERLCVRSESCLFFYPFLFLFYSACAEE